MFAITKNIINLTPHALNIHTNNGAVLNLPPSGDVARVSTAKAVIAVVDGIPIYDTVLGDVTGLPDAVDGVLLVVSRIVKIAVPDRKDVLVPGAPIRDANGVIIGADGLTW